MAGRPRREFDWQSITMRRAQVLAGLARGWTDREIAERMGVRPSSVRSTVRELRDLVNLRSRRELGNWWRRHSVEWLCALAEAGEVDCGILVRRWLRNEL